MQGFDDESDELSSDHAGATRLVLAYLDDDWDSIKRVLDEAVDSLDRVDNLINLILPLVTMAGDGFLSSFGNRRNELRKSLQDDLLMRLDGWW